MDQIHIPTHGPLGKYYATSPILIILISLSRDIINNKG